MQSKSKKKSYLLFSKQKYSNESIEAHNAHLVSLKIATKPKQSLFRPLLLFVGVRKARDKYKANRKEKENNLVIHLYQKWNKSVNSMRSDGSGTSDVSSSEF